MIAGRLKGACFDKESCVVCACGVQGSWFRWWLGFVVWWCFDKESCVVCACGIQGSWFRMAVRVRGLGGVQGYVLGFWA